MAKRRRPFTPIALLWTRRDQRRFIDAVEQLMSTVNDLRTVAATMTDAALVLQAKTARRRRSPAVSDKPSANGGAHEESHSQ